MAKKTMVVTVCDVHRGDVDAVGSVSWSLGDDTYRFDLCAEHLKEFQLAVRPWTRLAGAAGGSSAARTPAKTAGAATSGRRRGQRGRSNVDIRAWAAANGFTVAERGRIPGAVRDAFAAANSNKKKKNNNKT